MALASLRNCLLLNTLPGFRPCSWLFGVDVHAVARVWVENTKVAGIEEVLFHLGLELWGKEVAHLSTTGADNENAIEVVVSAHLDIGDAWGLLGSRWRSR